MFLVKSKWFIPILAVVVVIIAMYFLGRKSVYAELVIPADPDEIWAILMDVQDYENWNPVLVPIEGNFQEGTKLLYRMSQPDGKTSDVQATVRELIENEKLNQYGGVPGIMTFNHRWQLEPVEGGTKVIQHEEYRGIWVLFWDPSWYEAAYQNANEVLSKRVIDYKNADD